jgi:hypothetical protein
MILAPPKALRYIGILKQKGKEEGNSEGEEDEIE